MNCEDCERSIQEPDSHYYIMNQGHPSETTLCYDCYTDWQEVPHDLEFNYYKIEQLPKGSPPINIEE